MFSFIIDSLRDTYGTRTISEQMGLHLHKLKLAEAIRFSQHFFFFHWIIGRNHWIMDASKVPSLNIANEIIVVHCPHSFKLLRVEMHRFSICALDSTQSTWTFETRTRRCSANQFFRWNLVANITQLCRDTNDRRARFLFCSFFFRFYLFQTNFVHSVLVGALRWAGTHIR